MKWDSVFGGIYAFKINLIDLIRWGGETNTFAVSADSGCLCK